METVSVMDVGSTSQRLPVISKDLQVSCPICSANVDRHVPAQMAEFIRIRCDIFGSPETQSNFCEACEHVFFTPILDGQELAKLYTGYRGDDYNAQRLEIEPSYAGYIPEFASHESGYYTSRKAFYDFFLSDLKDLEGLVVDFGGDTGYFARYAFPKSEVIVVEESFERGGGDLNALLKRARVLFCAHVFEHISEPSGVMTRLVGGLEPGANILLELPLEYHGNLAARFAELEQRAARGDITPSISLQVLHEHLAHYSKKSAGRLLELAGARVLETYVSTTGIFCVKAEKI